MEDRAGAATKRRLLHAAAELFAARGFHGTTMRDIAARARVNLASGHYHYGSKQALYLAVLRDQFAHSRARLERRAPLPAPAQLRAAGRARLTALLHARLEVMLEALLGPPPTLHGALMMREMSDPTEALAVIVAEFIAPMTAELQAIVRQLAPGIDGVAARRCVLSIVGQALFYRFAMPVVLQLMGHRHYPADTSRAVAAHITGFSAAGVAASARRRRWRADA